MSNSTPQNQLLTDEDVTPRDLRALARKNIRKGQMTLSEQQAADQERYQRLVQHFQTTEAERIRYLRTSLLAATEPDKLAAHFAQNPDLSYLFSIPFKSCCGYSRVSNGSDKACLSYDAAILPEVRRLTNLPISVAIPGDKCRALVNFQNDQHDTEFSAIPLDRHDTEFSATPLSCYICLLPSLPALILTSAIILLLSPDIYLAGKIASGFLFVLGFLVSVYVLYRLARPFNQRRYVIHPQNILNV